MGFLDAVKPEALLVEGSLEICKMDLQPSQLYSLRRPTADRRLTLTTALLHCLQDRNKCRQQRRRLAGPRVRVVAAERGSSPASDGGASQARARRWRQRLAGPLAGVAAAANHRPALAGGGGGAPVLARKRQRQALAHSQQRRQHCAAGAIRRLYDISCFHHPKE
ncbi:hypothetical protein C2845_PM05G06970 [Panicum miliaceum]|uniref:Uncharacterized protein n=1 Tax=Panicum miliaceum TaxID=4540 RepID=A0A3L6SVW2_PANMI|nr:hypothetical protein C2845_PM05G06970 [Panicum miliaceum]